MILEKSNHLILILKFSNQNQMILSCDFRKTESFDFDFIFKDFKNDSIFAALVVTILTMQIMLTLN